ncbi:MAG: HlyD family efflux transporter periplasmic adaptor subunit [Bacteroidales bacterium]|nr:HlyD family efflux transporter periplasmic adaptor subunit [Bacteroidales bacterium]
MPELPLFKNKQEKIFLAGKNVLSEYYGILSDEERLNKYTLYAPFDGAFTNVVLETGSVANPGSRLASIIETGNLEVEVPLDPVDITWVKIGDKVKVTGESFKDTLSGTIVRKASFVDPATQSFNVYAKLWARAGQGVYNGQYLQVHINDVTVDNAMEIPRNAVFNSNEVYTVKDSILYKKQIKVIRVAEHNIIFRGLNKGEMVVSEPLASVREGMKVVAAASQKPQAPGRN